MLGAFLTTIFFSLSAIFATRSIRAVGPTRANLGRLIVALLCLGAYAHLIGGGMGGAGRNWFLLSGLFGMGLGDLAVFASLPLLGARLSVLMTQCLAAPIAMLAEWLWLGTTLTAAQTAWGFVILAGVTMALLPSRKNPPRVPVKFAGFFFGALGAVGQGVGAVASRKANAVAALTGAPVDGVTAAYQRIVGGLAVTLIFFALRWLLRRHDISNTPPPPGGRGWLWVPANALCGAVIGVSCYQWSLATTPSGIVLPIVACTPLVIVPLSYLIDGEQPTRRSLAGGVVAVAGCIALTFAR